MCEPPQLAGFAKRPSADPRRQCITKPSLKCQKLDCMSINRERAPPKEFPRCQTSGTRQTLTKPMNSWSPRFRPPNGLGDDGEDADGGSAESAE